MPWTGQGWGSSTTKTNPVLPQSQGPLTTKAPLWVTSSLLPILAPTPPSLLVATNTMVVSKAGKPIYLRCLPAPSLLTRSLWQLYWSKEEKKGKEGMVEFKLALIALPAGWPEK